MYCIDCGVEVLATAKFCAGCGARQTGESVDPAPQKEANSDGKDEISNKLGGLAAVAASAMGAAKKVGEEINRISEEHGVKEKLINAAAAAKAAAADASNSFAEDVKKINDAKSRTMEENIHVGDGAKTDKARAFGKSFFGKLTKRQKLIIILPFVALLLYVANLIVQKVNNPSPDFYTKGFYAKYPDAGVLTESKQSEDADKINCESYEVSKIAVQTGVADWTFACSDMVRDGAYSELRVSTKYINNKCMVNMHVSGIINGNSKTCNVSKEVDKVLNNMVMYVKP